MYKEKIIEHGQTTVTNWHANVPYLVAPVIDKEVTLGGVRHYKDKAGKVHNAETFDRVWGKRDSKRILPPKKREFQRIHKF